MGKFREKLLEAGSLSGSIPGGELVFRVPLSSLVPIPDDPNGLVRGDWRAAVEVGGRPLKEVSGRFGEDVLTELLNQLRTP